MKVFNSVIGATTLVLGGLLANGAALAQDYPNKPIRLIVGWPAGGTVDTVARTLAPALAEGLGQSFIVENKPGASGSIAASEVATAKADGYTLGVVFDTQAVNHHLYRGLRYDPIKSFTYISRLVTAPQILVASNSFPATDAAGLIAYAKANPGKVTYASTGIGSSNHLNALSLASQAGIEMLHVPYKGGAPALVDLAGEQIDIMIVSAPSTIPLVTDGRIKALATGSTQPLSQLPEARPIADAVPGFEANSWVGLISPAGLPEEVLARLQTEVIKAIKNPDVSAKLQQAGYNIVGSTTEEFTDFMVSESDKWGKIIDEYKIETN